METIHTIGRRKTAVARIYVKGGNGKITINNRDLENYFTTQTLQYKVKQPLALTNNEESFDINVNVFGGGITGQAEAVRLAISRAMCQVDEENRGILKPEGLLTRDPRMVERKKYGQKKARKKFQFSKR
ncbi:MAG TPA: 30S ribosomal protein S9 [Flavobacteriaceae bacterium]|nr:30S ribosomal protein S9 [Flavobacteriaceae bacterium]